MTEGSTSPPQPTNFLQWCLVNPGELAGMGLSVLLTVVVFLQVIFRYFLHIPLAWGEEFAMFLFQWVSFVGAAIAVRHRFHYTLDLITKRFPGHWKIVTEILGSIALFVTSYLMIHMGIGMMGLTKFQTYSVIGISVAYGYLVIPISGGMMIYYHVPIFIRQIQALTRR
jgi:TRAP-type C4-dicarboxylate transport system permease small subunit